MSTETPHIELTPEQRSAAARMAAQAAAGVAELVKEMGKVIGGPSAEHETFQIDLREKNARGARRTTGRIV